MSRKIISKILIILFVIAFGVACACTGDITNPVGTLWSLFPPVVAICLALLTKEVYSSLFIGILAGSLLASGFHVTSAVDTVVSDGFISAITDTAGVFVFLVILGTIVALLNKAGGSKAFGDWASTHIKTKAGVCLATLALGVLIFIDDYFNCLTVGAVMRPVADQAKVSRSKLAYIIDATAAPICMIAPVSSWAAAVSSYTPEGENGILLFCKAIPFNFYSILTIVFVIALILLNVDFGPMKLHEENALKGDLFTSGQRNDAADEAPITDRGRVIDLIIPIIALIVFCIGALIYVGRGMGLDYDGSIGIIDAFADTDATIGLPWGALLAMILIIIYFIARKLISFKEAMGCISTGFCMMVPAILILTMAGSLKNVTGLLDSSSFVESTLSSAAGLSSFLPAIIFVIACFIAFATGTSWGTFGILIPIVLAIFPIESTMGVICMSACLAGAVCGDHCSPISDTTIMSSAGAQCDHLNHVSTQIPYALTVAGISTICFLIAGFTQNLALSLGTGVVLVLGTLLVLKKVNAKA